MREKFKEKFKAYYDCFEQKVVNLASKVGKTPEKIGVTSFKKKLERRIPHGTRSQLDAYKVRKKLLFKRMQLAAFAMCLLIIFLVWLQDYIPSYNRKFWSRGIGPEKF